MKTEILSIPLFWFFAMFSCSSLPLRADDAAKAKQPGIYDESANGDKLVADAVALANREHKRILLQFGANWCSWCRRLHNLFESDESVSKELKGGYVVVLIDVNNGHNKDLVVKYGAETDFGLPFLVVLDSDGKHLITKHSEDFEEADHHDPQKVLAFLKAPLMTNDRKPHSPIENPSATTHAPTRHSPIENPSPNRDEASSREIATELLEMRHRWATNGYRANGMVVPKFLAEQGEVSGYSAGILGAYVQYNFQNGGTAWTRRFQILRFATNATTWVLYEFAAPKDTNRLQMASERELATVTKEP